MTSDTRNTSSHWVFGYGSLIWRPGFDYLSSRPALLRGAHRSLCIYSHQYRGTPEQPGLVFGLRRGGSCHGMAFEVADNIWPEVHDYLHEREQVTKIYHESLRWVRLDTGNNVCALTFIADESHEQFAGPLDLATQLAHVRTAAGDKGSNAEYVVNTAQHLQEMGLADQKLLELSALLTS